ncbi:hypothetical protein C8R45DRAFT_1100989 [Mycena sanguinolenta]|nr:hypothetical protein C8R45DRAFT_1100989 [Mycena sanguinolenta]
MTSFVNDANIPDGFICVNDHPTELWSKAAFEHVERLQTEEENRNLDAHEGVAWDAAVYIYNDYFGYAYCDLNEMLAIGKIVASKTEKLSINNFHRLEALTLYMAKSGVADAFPTIDDPELSAAIYNAVKVITQYAGLGFHNDAEELQTPMLRVLARNDMDGTPKEKLFLSQSNNSGDEDDEDEEEDEGSAPKNKRRPRADDADVRAAAKAWKASAAMKALREAYGPVEHGGRPWDITKWPKAALAAEKARFGNLDGDDDDDALFF